MPEVGQGREGHLALARAALAALEASRRRIDDLNVYPVPDGDTGTNMVETARAVVGALERDEGADIARAALMGARGNSGVILSQIVRGALEGLGEGEVDAAALAAALRLGSDRAYASLREPQEGTMLTVARAMAERAEELAREAQPTGDLLAAVLTHGEDALARTEEQLDVLKAAGVVDAGGAGLVEIVRGITAQVRGEPLPEARPAPERLPLEAVHVGQSRYRYCTSFFVEGPDADPDHLETELGSLGDSLLVVGSQGAVKVHLHTDEPGRALALGTSLGTVEEVDIKNMHVQTAERQERLLAASVSGVVAVSAGGGLKRLFESFGATCVDGGRTMNPSTADLVQAIEAVPANDVVVLPNSKNVLMAAEHAAEASSRRVRVVPTRTLQAGLGALVAYNPGRSAEDNAIEMEEAAAAVRTGAVTRATRTASFGPVTVEEGHFLGLVDGEPVTAGPVLEPVAREVVERLLGNAAGVLTVLLGEEAAAVDELVQGLRTAHPELEVEVHEGGQPYYPLLFAVE